MVRTDTLVVLMLFISATSPQFYIRYRSPGIQRLRQFMSKAVLHRPRSRLGARSKASASNLCRMETVLIALRPLPMYSRSCAPVFIETIGCRGGCLSYSQLDPRNFTNIKHSCSCCQPIFYDAKPVKVKLPCRTGVRNFVSIKRVKSCQCRPCYADSKVNEFHKLRDLMDMRAAFSSG